MHQCPPWGTVQCDYTFRVPHTKNGCKAVSTHKAYQTKTDEISK